MVHSLFSFITVLSNKNEVNIYIPMSALFLLYAGFNLYHLKEAGRKLTVILFLLQAVISIAILAWFFWLEGKSFQLWINFLDRKYVIAENRIAITVSMLALSFAAILLTTFLLQKKTRELFSSEKLSTQP